MRGGLPPPAAGGGAGHGGYLWPGAAPADAPPRPAARGGPCVPAAAARGKLPEPPDPPPSPLRSPPPLLLEEPPVPQNHPALGRRPRESGRSAGSGSSGCGESLPWAGGAGDSRGRESIYGWITKRDSHFGSKIPVWVILGWLVFVDVETGFYIGRMRLKKCQKFQENVDVIFMLLQVQKSPVGIRLSESTWLQFRG